MRRAAALATVGIIGLLSGRPVPGAEPGPGDWPLHSLDVRNGRYSTLEQIDTTTASRLGVQWSFTLPEGESAASETPVAVDGVLYVNSGSKLYAVDGATGHLRWTTEVQPSFMGGGRGPAYGDGRIYAFGPTMIYAVDALTGRAVESFGERGVLPVVNRALEAKDPGRYPASLDPTTLGYSMTTPPMYYGGTLYLGIGISDSLIAGGLLVALDGRTGEIRWVFRTVPQGPSDDGWDLAKETWKGSHRSGGGIWTPPAIDSELGLIYANVGNPTPNYDASSRPGENLFTNSLIALDLKTGRLKWHYQVVHHDIWDWDLSTGPALFDLTIAGRRVKAVATQPKNCFAYFFERDTGRPINPIVETPVPTTTDVPGEQPWPTQPIPYTSRHVPQQPYCAIYPRVTDPDLVGRVRPLFHPYLSKEFVITSPGNQGGPNYGPPSFSPRTGLFYVSGKNDAYSIKAKVIGSDLPRQGPGARGHFGLIAEVGKTGMTTTQSVAAYDPGTGNLAWLVEVPRGTNTGSLVTAGDVLVHAVDRQFYVFDARSGVRLFETSLEVATRSTPMTYLAGGRQFLAMVSGNAIVALGLR